MNTSQRLQVGVDVSQVRLDHGLLAPDGQIVEQHQPFANSQAGYQQAKALLLQALHTGGFDGLDVAVEATSYYWLPYFVQLSQDPDLARYDPHLYLLNARWVRWYKQSLPPDHHDDPIDPRYIADRIRTHKPAYSWQYDPKWLGLRMLTRLHVHLSKAVTREKNLFQLYLFLAYNTYPHYRPFHDFLGQTSQKLLRQPELLEQLAQLPLDQFAEQLDELSGHLLPEPHKNALRLKRVLQDSFALPDQLGVTVHFILEQLMATIGHLQEDLRQVDQQIAHLVQSGDYPDVALLDSIPGVGPVLATGLSAEIAGLERFQRVPKWDNQRKAYRPRRLPEIEDAIAKIAGLWWPKHASGKFTAEERLMSKEGNAYLRYYILEAADCMRRNLRSYAAYYQSKYDQANKHKHKRALVLSGRKALGLFVALLHHRQTYRAKEADELLV